MLLQYDAKVFVCRVKNNVLLSQQVAESINANDKRAVYRHIVKSDVNVNAISREAGTFNPRKKMLQLKKQKALLE